MKSTPFILLILGIAFIWLGLTGRLGAVLAAIFEPSTLMIGDGGSAGVHSPDPPIPGTGSNPFYNDPLTIPET